MKESEFQIEDLLRLLQDFVGRYPDYSVHIQLCYDSVSRKKDGRPYLDPREAAIVAAIKTGAQVLYDISAETGIDRITAHRVLDKLREAGMVEAFRGNNEIIYHLSSSSESS